MPNKLIGVHRRTSPLIARRLRALCAGSTLMASSAGFDDVDEDDGDEESPDVERQLARLLVGGRVVRRRRARRAALVRFLRNRE